jgi:hypothetical protein
LNVELEWNVESEEGDSSVEEDAAVVHARNVRARNLRRAIVVIAVIALITGSAALWRLNQVDRQLRDALQATIDAEVLALRLGDKHRFMEVQGTSEQWQAQQRATFDALALTGGRAEIPGEVLAMDVSGDQAKVVMRVLMDERLSEAVWYYDYTDEGWLHVASDSEPWMIESETVAGLTMTYAMIDQPLADNAREEIEAWWQKTRLLTGLTRMPPMEVVIDWQAAPGYSAVRTNKDSALIVVAPISDRGEYYDSVDGTLELKLMRLTVGQWTAAALSPLIEEAKTAEDVPAWLIADTRAMILHAVDPVLPESQVLDPMNTAFPEFSPRYLDWVRRGRDVPGGIYDTMLHSAPNALAGEALNAYLTNYLRAEIAYRGFMEKAPLAARTAFLHDSTSTIKPTLTVSLSSGYHSFTENVEPEQITVTNSYPYYNVLWAETRIHREGMDKVLLIPFQRYANQWLHAGSIPKNWGRVQVQSKGLITIEHNAIDAPFVPEGTAVRLNALYLQASRDFGVASPEPVYLEFSPYVMTGPAYSIGNAGFAAYVTSPYVYSSTVQPGRSLQDSLFDTMAHQVLAALVEQVDREFEYHYPGDVLRSPLVMALRLFEAEQHGVKPLPEIWVLQPTDFPLTLPDHLDVLIEGRGEAGTSSFTVDVIAARVLLDMLIKRSGPDVIARIFAAVQGDGRYNGVWIYRITGTSASEIVPEWRIRTIAKLREMGYTVEE